ncbi:conserved hypothetical protein [Candidatus Magnetomoraceae bacterium gMMP-1]
MLIKIKRLCVILMLLAILWPMPVWASPELDNVRTLLETRQLEKALKGADDFLKQNPSQPEALFLRSLILFELGRTSESIEVFKALTLEYPSKPELYNNLAVAYAVQSEYELARDALSRAIEIYPEYAKAHENLGDVYLNIARMSYEKALGLDSNKSTLKSKISLINKLSIMQSPSNAGQRQGPPMPSSPPFISKKIPVQKEIKKETIKPAPPALASVNAKTVVKAEVKKKIPPPPLKVSAPPVKSSAPPEPEIKKSRLSPGPCMEWADNSELKVAEENLIMKALQKWAHVWSEMDVNAYLSCYAPDFKPSGNMSRNAWERQRRERLNKEYIKVVIDKPFLNFVTCKLARVTFIQTYESNGYKDKTKKLILIKKINDEWRILKEGNARR